MTSRPYIIVTLGPTGSGKTKLITKTISYLGLSSSYTKFLVDDLVENNKVYKEKVSAIISKVMRQCQEEAKFCLDKKCDACNTSNYYLNPTAELLKEFNDAYFSVRKGPYCTKDNILNCDDLNNERLKEAIKNEDNIVLETTGMYIPSWLLSKPFINAKYHVIFSYSLVGFETLIQRNKNRILQSITEFRKNATKPGPRLPNIEPGAFKKIVGNIKNVLLTLYEMCVLKYMADICGTQKIDTLLLFDNNTSDMALVFDSSAKDKMSKPEFVAIVNKLFDLRDEQLGGGRGRGRGTRSHLFKYPR